jgi:outer membrane protein assembly factor BamB
MRSLGICLTFLLVNIAPAADPTKGSDWPAFLGPQGNSTSTEKGILSPWPRDGLRLVWSHKTGEGYAIPCIHQGKLFLFDRHEDKARLTCMEPRTGKPLWKFEYETKYEDKFNYSGGPRCCPIADGDRVYIYGPEGILHCLKTADGSVVWKVDTFKEYGVIQNFFGVGGAPVLEGDLIIAQVGGSPKGSEEVDFDKLKGNGSGVVAWDKKTGKEKWKLSNELASYSSPTLATIGGRRWCFVLARGGLLAFEPATGKQDFFFRWRAKSLESVNASNPVVIGDKVFISETYGPGSALLQVKPGEYKVLWSDADKGRNDKSMQCHWMTPIYHDGYLYGSSGRHDTNAELRCIELETGKEMWTKPRLARTSLLMVDGHFICMAEYGELLLLKVNPKKLEVVSVMVVFPPGKDGKPDREADPLLTYPCWAAPVLSHGLLYLRGKEHLVCLELIPEKK